MINFNVNIPNPPNNPSNDVSLMQENTNAENSIWQVDHLGFNVNNSGTHLQNTFIGFATPPTPSGIGSVAFPSAGIIDNTHGQYYFKNALATFPLSAIRAFATFPATGVSPVPSVSYNVSSIAIIGGTTFTATLATNAVTGNNIAVFLSNTLQAATSWTFSNPTLMVTSATISGQNISFLIMQI